MPATAAPTLERFRSAQDASDGGYASALAELRAGAKRGHWIWYVFPQIEGLGYSELSRKFAIRDLDEAIAYPTDPVLLARLLEISSVVAEHARRGVLLTRLMGSQVDALKLVSSMTLFESVAERLAAAGQREVHRALASAASAILTQAEAQGMARCRHTLERLA